MSPITGTAGQADESVSQAQTADQKRQEDEKAVRNPGLDAEGNPKVVRGSSNQNPAQSNPGAPYGRDAEGNPKATHPPQPNPASPYPYGRDAEGNPTKAAHPNLAAPYGLDAEGNPKRRP